MRSFLAFTLGLVLALPAMAQRMPSHCIALAEGVSGVQYAALGGMPDLSREEVRIHYIGHSTMLLETPGGISIATDFTGFVGAGILPDVVTMNRAHSSHYTDFPDPAIPHVLKGWGDAEAPAAHYLDLDEVIIRNVTTDIRDGFGGRAKDGNSIFVFEVAGLCIGHLGHLHHEPSDEQYGLIGRLDIVMVPVDGGMTLPVDDMIRVVQRFRSSIVIPMHWFGDGTLGYFLDRMKEEFAITLEDGNSLTTSLRDLPRRPTIHVLRPRPITSP